MNMDALRVVFVVVALLVAVGISCEEGECRYQIDCQPLVLDVNRSLSCIGGKIFCCKEQLARTNFEEALVSEDLTGNDDQNQEMMLEIADKTLMPGISNSSLLKSNDNKITKFANSQTENTNVKLHSGPDVVYETQKETLPELIRSLRYGSAIAEGFTPTGFRQDDFNFDRENNTQVNYTSDVSQMLEVKQREIKIPFRVELNIPSGQNIDGEALESSFAMKVVNKIENGKFDSILESKLNDSENSNIQTRNLMSNISETEDLKTKLDSQIIQKDVNDFKNELNINVSHNDSLANNSFAESKLNVFQNEVKEIIDSMPESTMNDYVSSENILPNGQNNGTNHKITEFISNLTSMPNNEDEKKKINYSFDYWNSRRFESFTNYLTNFNETSDMSSTEVPLEINDGKSLQTEKILTKRNPDDAVNLEDKRNNDDNIELLVTSDAVYPTSSDNYGDYRHVYNLHISDTLDRSNKTNDFSSQREETSENVLSQDISPFIVYPVYEETTVKPIESTTVSHNQTVKGITVLEELIQKNLLSEYDSLKTKLELRTENNLTHILDKEMKNQTYKSNQSVEASTIPIPLTPKGIEKLETTSSRNDKTTNEDHKRLAITRLRQKTKVHVEKEISEVHTEKTISVRYGSINSTSLKSFQPKTQADINTNRSEYKNGSKRRYNVNSNKNTNNVTATSLSYNNRTEIMIAKRRNYLRRVVSKRPLLHHQPTTVTPNSEVATELVSISINNASNHSYKEQYRNESNQTGIIYENSNKNLNNANARINVDHTTIIPAQNQNIPLPLKSNRRQLNRTSSPDLFPLKPTNFSLNSGNSLKLFKPIVSQYRRRNVTTTPLPDVNEFETNSDISPKENIDSVNSSQAIESNLTYGKIMLNYSDNSVNDSQRDIELLSLYAHTQMVYHEPSNIESLKYDTQSSEAHSTDHSRFTNINKKYSITRPQLEVTTDTSESHFQTNFKPKIHLHSQYLVDKNNIGLQKINPRPTQLPYTSGADHSGDFLTASISGKLNSSTISSNTNNTSSNPLHHRVRVGQRYYATNLQQPIISPIKAKQKFEGFNNNRQKFNIPHPMKTTETELTPMVVRRDVNIIGPIPKGFIERNSETTYDGIILDELLPPLDKDRPHILEALPYMTKEDKNRIFNSWNGDLRSPDSLQYNLKNPFIPLANIPITSQTYVRNSQSVTNRPIFRPTAVTELIHHLSSTTLPIQVSSVSNPVRHSQQNNIQNQKSIKNNKFITYVDRGPSVIVEGQTIENKEAAVSQEEENKKQYSILRNFYDLALESYNNALGMYKKLYNSAMSLQ